MLYDCIDEEMTEEEIKLVEAMDTAVRTRAKELLKAKGQKKSLFPPRFPENTAYVSCLYPVLHPRASARLTADCGRLRGTVQGKLLMERMRVRMGLGQDEYLHWIHGEDLWDGILTEKRMMEVYCQLERGACTIAVVPSPTCWWLQLIC